MDTGRNKKKINWLFVTGLLLIAAALLLVVYNVCDEARARRSTQDILAELSPAADIAREEKDRAEEMAAGEGREAIADYKFDSEREMPECIVDGDGYIGVLQIPTLGLELPVMSQWSYPGLKIAPCRYTGSAYQNDLVICAHNYTSHFGTLKYLHIGDDVIFTDMDGNDFRYTVSQVETLQPTAIDEMTSGDWDLTLFTCTIGGATRVVIRCTAA